MINTGLPYMVFLQIIKSKFILLIVFFFTHLTNAQQVNIGPNIGAKAPKIVALDKKGQAISREALQGEKGLILLFFRSADWCPFCQKHLIEFNEQAKQLKNLGYGLAAVSYDNTQVLSTFTKKHNINYPLLSDIEANTMINYGILNSRYGKKSKHYGIPFPGVIVINQQGNITHKHFFEGYKKRVKFTELYNNLKVL